VTENLTVINAEPDPAVRANGPTLLPPPGDPSSIGSGFGPTGSIAPFLRWLDPEVSLRHTASWWPDPSRASLGYGSQGVDGSSQVWIAPWVVADSNGTPVFLPMALRQLLSWNRERYQAVNRFADHDIDNPNDPAVFPTERYNVVQKIDLKPRLDISDVKLEEMAFSLGGISSTGLLGYAGLPELGVGYGAEVFQKIRYFAPDGSPLPRQQTFPSIRGQWWEVTLQFAPDPYVNRFGYRYCSIEIKPNTRLESFKHLPMGVVPTGADGNPNFSLVDAENGGDSSLIERLTTGFPLREGQIEIVMRYPWVSAERLLRAGPIGNSEQIGAVGLAPVNPFNMPPGQLLVTVNRDAFLGFTRGRVLYVSAEIEEAASPVTGRLGYRVSNHFIVNVNREWNQSRYSPPKAGVLNMAPIQADMTPTWGTGFMVMLDPAKSTNTIYKFVAPPAVQAQAVYPYPYRDWSGLVYYGSLGDGQVFESEG